MPSFFALPSLIFDKIRFKPNEFGKTNEFGKSQVFPTFF